MSYPQMGADGKANAMMGRLRMRDGKCEKEIAL